MRLAALLVTVFSMLAALDAQQPAHERPGEAWTLSFSDDFSGPELNLSRWIPHDPFGSQKGLATVNFSNGAVRLRGVISTLGVFSQLYGRFEVRCRMLDPGARVRVRLLPVHVANLPSIDLFEAGAHGPSRIFFANHWGTDQTERSYGDWFDSPDLSAAMHTFSVVWDRGRIVWAVDGKDRFQSVDGIPDQPMFLEIAGDSITGPALEVASVRIYRRP